MQRVGGGVNVCAWRQADEGLEFSEHALVHVSFQEQESEHVCELRHESRHGCENADQPVVLPRENVEFAGNA